MGICSIAATAEDSSKIKSSMSSHRRVRHERSRRSGAGGILKRSCRDADSILVCGRRWNRTLPTAKNQKGLRTLWGTDTKRRRTETITTIITFNHVGRWGVEMRRFHKRFQSLKEIRLGQWRQHRPWSFCCALWCRYTESRAFAICKRRSLAIRL